MSLHALAIVNILAAVIAVLIAKLRESRAMQLRLADRIYLAHEVLARRAERKSS